ncbi:MAG: bifunctional demethylmenaquinone methyltransferase/2-methoxy-6-polyprenyl-1,4-benzoquinol methylase UbiE [Chlorobi bacterium]|nr:bifunctional demethylmenaquinone methyltransferase/2-methoxy-6-polyprenyl-1,4-benzoquinol methylase UbiE [Chlorobiota bacterium]
MNEKKEKVQKLFDNISQRYDFLNHFLSLGIDFYWRKKSLKLANLEGERKLLDVACGTGDFSIAAKKFGVESIIGADLSLNMLKLFSEKEKSMRGKLAQSVAEYLPFKNGQFDLITVAFGVRNFYDIPRGFAEFHRILSDKGKTIVLEFRLPTNRIIKSIYLFYFNKILPALGKMISKDREAYQYLPDSVREFDENINLVEIFKSAGFNEVKKYSLTFGLVQVVIAQK